MNGETLWSLNFVENAHYTSWMAHTFAITQGVPSGEDGSEFNGRKYAVQPRISENIRKGKNMGMKVKLDNGAFCPTRAHETDAGLDLYTPVDVCVPKGEAFVTLNAFKSDVRNGSATIDTGVHVEIPNGYVGYIKSKSGLMVKHGLTADGTIDAGYTGSIRVKLFNHTHKDYFFNAGDKIAQLVIHPIITPDLELVDSLEETERGSNGFGSTGR